MGIAGCCSETNLDADSIADEVVDDLAIWDAGVIQRRVKIEHAAKKCFRWFSAPMLVESCQVQFVFFQSASKDFVVANVLTVSLQE